MYIYFNLANYIDLLPGKGNFIMETILPVTQNKSTLWKFPGNLSEADGLEVFEGCGQPNTMIGISGLPSLFPLLEHRVATV